MDFGWIDTDAESRMVGARGEVDGNGLWSRGT